jgi:hypothetical protein
MNTTFEHVIDSSVSNSPVSVWKSFTSWTVAQEKNRFLWLALGVVAHGCVITIFTMLAIMFSGNNFIYWPFAIAAMTMTVVSNLAAMPTKITIPVFFFSVLIDVAIILLCIIQGFGLDVVYNTGA